jgi:opacity protein-like surface antigen
MRTRSAVIAAAVLAALAAAPAARAQPVSEPSGPDTYLVLGLGAFMPGGDRDRLDPGVALSGTFGARVSRHVGAEATVGYYRASATTLRASPPALDVETSLNAVPILASLRLTLPLDRLELSARAGVGLHLASLHAKGGASVYETATAFGWHAGAGAALELSRTMLVGADVLATFASAKFAGVSTSLDGVQLSVTLGYRL